MQGTSSSSSSFLVNASVQAEAEKKFLFDYQKTGVEWFQGLYAKRKGGILGDEMGLGKTIQALSFLEHTPDIEVALVLCPLSLLDVWEREAKTWAPRFKTICLRLQKQFRNKKRSNLALQKKFSSALFRQYISVPAVGVVVPSGSSGSSSSSATSTAVGGSLSSSSSSGSASASSSSSSSAAIAVVAEPDVSSWTSSAASGPRANKKSALLFVANLDLLTNRPELLKQISVRKDLTEQQIRFLFKKKLKLLEKHSGDDFMQDAGALDPDEEDTEDSEGDNQDDSDDAAPPVGRSTRKRPASPSTLNSASKRPFRDPATAVSAPSQLSDESNGLMGKQHVLVAHVGGSFLSTSAASAVAASEGKDKSSSNVLNKPPSNSKAPPSQKRFRSFLPDSKYHWDVVLVDEAHRCKDPSGTLSRNLRAVQAVAKFLITGTPLQNEVRDLWNLHDCCNPGILGNLQSFTKNFATPINKGMLKNAGELDVELKNVLSAQLQDRTRPYYLHRTKRQVKTMGEVTKTDVVLWLRPTKKQVKFYQTVLQNASFIQEARESGKMGTMVFKAITYLKKLSNSLVLCHPDFVTAGSWVDYVTGLTDDLTGLVSTSMQEPIGMDLQQVGTTLENRTAGAVTGPRPAKIAAEVQAKESRALPATTSSGTNLAVLGLPTDEITAEKSILKTDLLDSAHHEGGRTTGKDNITHKNTSSSASSSTAAAVAFSAFQDMNSTASKKSAIAEESEFYDAASGDETPLKEAESEDEFMSSPDEGVEKLLNYPAPGKKPDVPSPLRKRSPHKFAEEQPDDHAGIVAPNKAAIGGAAGSASSTSTTGLFGGSRNYFSGALSAVAAVILPKKLSSAAGGSPPDGAEEWVEGRGAAVSDARATSSFSSSSRVGASAELLQEPKHDSLKPNQIHTTTGGPSTQTHANVGDIESLDVAASSSGGPSSAASGACNTVASSILLPKSSPITDGAAGAASLKIMPSDPGGSQQRHDDELPKAQGDSSNAAAQSPTQKRRSSLLKKEEVSLISGAIEDKAETLMQLRDDAIKLAFLSEFLPVLIARQHKILLFSSSTKMLDLIMCVVLKPLKIRCLRIDGSTEVEDRNRKVQRFQNLQGRKAFDVFLASTQVGGVGLTLTAADRVVIIDPSWNPSTDHQAIDRAFRVGQTRNVVAYRLIATGLIEEKMFRYQVFKQGLAKSCLVAAGADHHEREDVVSATSTDLVAARGHLDGKINASSSFGEKNNPTSSSSCSAEDTSGESIVRNTATTTVTIEAQTRYFTNKDIHDLFEFLEPEQLDTCNRLEEEHGRPDAAWEAWLRDSEDLQHFSTTQPQGFLKPVDDDDEDEVEEQASAPAAKRRKKENRVEGADPPHSTEVGVKGPAAEKGTGARVAALQHMVLGLSDYNCLFGHRGGKTKITFNQEEHENLFLDNADQLSAVPSGSGPAGASGPDATTPGDGITMDQHRKVSKLSSSAGGASEKQQDPDTQMKKDLDQSLQGLPIAEQKRLLKKEVTELSRKVMECSLKRQKAENDRKDACAAVAAAEQTLKDKIEAKRTKKAAEKGAKQEWLAEKQALEDVERARRLAERSLQAAEKAEKGLQQERDAAVKKHQDAETRQQTAKLECDQAEQRMKEFDHLLTDAEKQALDDCETKQVEFEFVDHAAGDRQTKRTQLDRAIERTRAALTSSKASVRSFEKMSRLQMQWHETRWKTQELQLRARDAEHAVGEFQEVQTATAELAEKRQTVRAQEAKIEEKKKQYDEAVAAVADAEREEETAKTDVAAKKQRAKDMQTDIRTSRDEEKKMTRESELKQAAFAKLERKFQIFEEKTKNGLREMETEGYDEEQIAKLAKNKQD
ncbi:unnamed protein product [Amoebophrya sp. A120]|nr:unnamed protein product [Amoebophrya sp. A120]|eukprot:GSA120T00004829001.1